MGVIVQSPGELSSAHDCLIYVVQNQNDININAGTQASFSVDFISGGTATDGTIIVIQGQRFEINNSAVSVDGYYIKFDGLTDEERATWLLETLNTTLFFDPEKVYVFQTSSTGANVLYNQVGQQGNWQFDNGGISEISFILGNGADRVDLSNPSYIFSVYEDRSILSLPPIKIAEDRILPLTLDYDNSTAPVSVSVPEQQINIADCVSKLVSTTLPSVYAPIFSPIIDEYFRKRIFMRVGFRYLSGCNNIDTQFSNTDRTWVYNSLFQKDKITSMYLSPLAPYVLEYKPLLIKNTYTLCRGSNMFVWSLCPEATLDVVYYDTSGAAIESSSFTYGNGEIDSNYINNVKPTYMNVGCFGQTIPSNVAYYILNYMNADGSELLHAVRINVVSCGCIEGEFIFRTDLGTYETTLMDKAVKHEIPVESEIIESAVGCTVVSLVKGGRSIVNKETESVWTFEKWVDVDTADELEFIAQFQRSQSFYMKQFINASDVYAYVKVIPENITFVPKETGKRPKLTFTIRFNQNLKSHPENEAFFPLS